MANRPAAVWDEDPNQAGLSPENTRLSLVLWGQPRLSKVNFHTRSGVLAATGSNHIQSKLGRGSPPAVI
jgi:hypothetical protein